MMIMRNIQMTWKNMGLPADALSVENAVAMTRGHQTPLALDPSGRIASFLLKLYPNAVLLRANQEDLYTQVLSLIIIKTLNFQVELGVRFGKTLIIDDVPRVPAQLVPLLRKDLSTQGPRMMVILGDKQVDFHQDFRLFLCTRSESKGLRSLVSEVNFFTTRGGLSAQLLDAAIEFEKPELQVRSHELARDSDEKKAELEKLEQQLLQQLASSQGNLLEDKELLESLNKSKESAETLSTSIAESERLTAQLKTERDAYLSLADTASALFFAFSDLHLRNHMYSFNVNTIMHLFNKSLAECKEETGRVEALQRDLRLSVFFYVSRALFKSDRLGFALTFVHSSIPNLFHPNVGPSYSK